jgi:hypothetical protein
MAWFGRLYSRSWDGIDVDDTLIIPREKLLRILRLGRLEPSEPRRGGSEARHRDALA